MPAFDLSGMYKDLAESIPGYGNVAKGAMQHQELMNRDLEYKKALGINSSEEAATNNSERATKSADLKIVQSLQQAIEAKIQELENKCRFLKILGSYPVGE